MTEPVSPSISTAAAAVALSPRRVSSSAPILPGATLGMLGSGQLGRMFAIAARRLGYRVHVLSPDDDTPTGQVADVEVRASYHDLERVAQFARQVSVVTFEFENVPSETTAVCERLVPVRPAGRVLAISQHRLREKSYLQQAGLPVTPFCAVSTAAELVTKMQGRTSPAVLKTAQWGYDGKGQTVVRDAADAPAAWHRVFSTSLSPGATSEAATLGTRTQADATAAQRSGDGPSAGSIDSSNPPRGGLPTESRVNVEAPGILEDWIDFAGELSVVAARGADGEIVTYGPIWNSHAHHILDVSVCPAPVAPSVQADAIEITRGVMTALDVVGVLCVEYFLTNAGQLLINETAPRPHNSGHLTIDAHVTCQFEQQVRAVCGLPLGSATQVRAAAMANLLGEVWLPGSSNPVNAPPTISAQATSPPTSSSSLGPVVEPNWAAALRSPSVKLHLYGKHEPRLARKMGHLTALADTPQEAEQLVRAARAALSRP
jgi:5-(carboxyamino)imidazole ribonucleotide synthase